jgi:hypothetical protein
MEKPYEFAEFDKQDNALDRIKQLEQQLSAEAGQEITLIAYSKDERNNPSDCRPGLDG